MVQANSPRASKRCCGDWFSVERETEREMIARCLARFSYSNSFTCSEVICGRSQSQQISSQLISIAFICSEEEFADV